MKAAKSCWTCKKRKIGCDKTLPACHNCIRTNRKCAGFGIKLTWPETYDGRRKPDEWANSYSAVVQAVGGRERDEDPEAKRLVSPAHFLNTTVEDAAAAFSSADISSTQRTQSRAVQNKERLRRSLLRVNTSVLPSHWPLGFSNDGANLLAYYESRLARIITTVDDAQNGFRNELIPMALATSQPSKASQSLLEAILALCAFHVGNGQSQALGHKARALGLLNESLQTEDADTSIKLAACMVLTVYGVFDLSDGKWMVHLRGAKGLMGGVGRNANRSQTQNDPSNAAKLSPFLRSWVLYHDVLAKFSEGTPETKCEQVVIPEYSPENTIVRFHFRV
jgi:hypothetical protein